MNDVVERTVAVLALAVVICLILLIGGMNSAGSALVLVRPAQVATTPQAVALQPLTQVQVTLWDDGAGSADRQWTITCPGDRACAQLLRRRALLRDDEPATCGGRTRSFTAAQVVGRVGGRRVEAFIERRDRCAETRWRTLRAVLTPPRPTG